MGYDRSRFSEEVDEELICPICTFVLEDPLQAPQCEHAFCSKCIHEWLTLQPTCPVDRNSITPKHLKPVPRILRNLLSRLEIVCDHSAYGCKVIVKLDALNSHLQDCDFNPRKPVHCQAGCGLVIPRNELEEHNCIKELRALINSQQEKLTDVQTENSEQKLQISELKRELQLVKEYLRSQRSANPHLIDIQAEMENSGVLRWLAGLQIARVTRWGGMISTPDAVLQSLIKRSLIDSGCPSHIVNDLMENAHERRWPPGLSTLETRQNNRREYETYVTKRIPGKQAVVVMACNNQHMPTELILEPGLVMIFAHGVE